MKKFLIVVAISALHINFADGMFGDTAKALVHYAAKYMDPEAYVLDSQNAKLYQSVLDNMNDKNISTLRITQFPDHNGTLQTIDFTLGTRVADRLTTLLTCLLQQSLIQDPNKQDVQKLYDMVTVNRLIIPDLFLGLALRSLQEQQNDKIQVSNSGSLIVDALLHKISLLPESDQFLLKNKLLGKEEQISLEQQRRTAEAYFLSLPQVEKEKLLEKMSQKKTTPTVNINSPKRITNNGVSKSPGNDGSSISNSLGSNNGNIGKLSNDNAINNSLGNENGDGFPYNPFENEKELTNKNDKF